MDDLDLKLLGLLRADARATVLSLCDGTHTLAEIEATTAARHASP